MGFDNGRHIVLVEDTKPLAEMYALTLQQGGYDVTIVHSGAALFDMLKNDAFTPDLLILDVKLPDADGLEILARLKELSFNAPVIVITGYGSVNTAVDAMRLGATDFLVKPFPIEKLTESVWRTLEASAGLSEKAKVGQAEQAFDAPHPMASAETAEHPAAEPKQRAGFGGFIGISPPMQLVYDIIESAAKSNATVFITGESGTGKELAAEAIHRYSRRTAKPFVAINCAAIPRELLESELFGHVKGAFTNAIQDRSGAIAQAHGGTLFLDEIAEMAPDMQTKLLRFLQNLTYQKVGATAPEKANVRIVCATNRDPLEEIRAGRLRQDLYYRLHVIPIHMPPLRHRKNDIIDLADYFLKLYAREENKSFRSFSPEAEKILTACYWPGNVRQLQNIIRSIAVLQEGRVVVASMLPPSLFAERIHEAQHYFHAVQESKKSDEGEITPLWKVEKEAIESAIAQCEGNIPKAAALLEISPSTIYRKKMMWDKGSHAQMQQYSGI